MDVKDDFEPSALRADIDRAALIASGERRSNAVRQAAWLADVLGRIAGHPASRLDELLAWNRRPTTTCAHEQ